MITIYVNSNAIALQVQVQLLFMHVNNFMIGK